MANHPTVKILREGEGRVDLEIRCPNCRCRPGEGKKLGELQGAPVLLLGSGLVIALPCISKKSRIRYVTL